MSKAIRERRLMAPPVGVLTIALLLVVALAGSRFGQTEAQDASPAAGSGECLAAATDAVSVDEGTPEAAPMGTPVDAATGEVAVAAAMTYVDCVNAGADLQISNLEADAESAVTYDDGRASINVTYMLGEYQYVAATWFMVMAGADLQVSEEDLGGVAPEGDTVVKSASVAVDATTVSFGQGGNVTESEVIALQLLNRTGTEDVSYLLFSVPSTDSGTPLAEGEVAATPTGAEAMMGELVGSITVPAGGEESMYLLNLPAGTYALVDPAVEGSVATLTVASLGI